MEGGIDWRYYNGVRKVSSLTLYDYSVDDMELTNVEFLFDLIQLLV